MTHTEAALFAAASVYIIMFVHFYIAGINTTSDRDNAQKSQK